MNSPLSPKAVALKSSSDSASSEPLTQAEFSSPPLGESLEELEAGYRYLFEANPHPMWIYDCETHRFLLVNEAAIHLYGYSQVEFLSMTIMDIRPAEDVPLVLASLKSHAPGKEKRGVWRHRRKDGQIRDVEVTTHDFRFRGRSARLTLANDVTEHRRIERALQQSEQEQRQLAEHLEMEKERLAEAQSIAKVGSWDLNLTTNVLFWSDETYRIFGMDQFEFGASYEAFLERVHPDDRAAVAEAFATAVANRTSYALDHRIQRKDGSIKFVHERCKITYDAGGTPIRAVGTVQDTTEQKQAEQALHHIMEGAHCLLWQAEVEMDEAKLLQWKLHFASEQAMQRFLPLHIPAGQTYGDAWYLSRPLEDRQRTDCYGEGEIRAGRSYQQELRCYSKEGELHWLAENVRVEILGEGRWRCTGVCTDITERKLAEEATRALTRGAQCLIWYAFVEETSEGLQWTIQTPDNEAAHTFFPVAQPAGMSYLEASTLARLPEDSAVMDARATEALRSGKQGYTNQFRCLRADGERRWINETVHIEALKPGHWRCVGVCMDVTEQKLAQDARAL